MLSAIGSNLAGILASYRVVSKPRPVGTLDVTRNGRVVSGDPWSPLRHLVALRRAGRPPLIAFNCSCITYCVETCTHGQRSVTMVHLLDYISGQPPTQSVPGPSEGIAHEAASLTSFPAAIAEKKTLVAIARSTTSSRRRSERESIAF